MSSFECPENASLSAWLGGDVPESEADSIADHVEGCQQCARKTERLEREETSLSVALRQAVFQYPDVDIQLPTRVLPPMEKPTSAFSETPTDPGLRALPKTVGDYQIVERLGHGGMGTVYRAVHTRLGKQVALKVLSTAVAEDAVAIARFRREMHVVGRLDHHNIVQALDAGEADGTHYLAMELLDGCDLSRLMQTTGDRITVSDVCETVRQAAVGLGYAHERGMVHRDVKPSNLMLTRDNTGTVGVKLLDLGLAIIQEVHTGELTDAGQLMGTLEYMAPEQTEDTHSVDQRADVYSLGATLYRLLTGAVPFAGERWNTPARRLRALLRDRAPSVGEHRDDLPAGLVTLVDSMLEPDPSRRPADMGQVAERLDEFSDGHNLQALLVRARPVADTPKVTEGIGPRALADTAPTIGPTALIPQQVSRAPASLVRRSRLLWTLVIFGTVGLVVGVAWWPRAGSDAPPDRTTRDAVQGRVPFESPLRATARELSRGCLAVWSFDDNDRDRLIDRSGRGQHGTLSAGSEKIDGAAPFPANRRALRLSEDAAVTVPLKIDSPAVSLTFWLRARSSSRERPLLTTNSDEGFSLSVATADGRQGRLILALHGQPPIRVLSEGRVATGSWHHVALVIGAEIRIFIDGSEQGALTGDGRSIVIDQLILRGNQSRRTDFDEVCAFDRELTIDEIRALTTIRPDPVTAAAPFSTKEAAGLQAAWAKHLGVPIEHTNDAGMTFRLIPPGEFLMGSPESDIEMLLGWDRRKRMHERYRTETPQRPVRISRPFYLGRCEVTQQQYQRIMGRNPSTFSEAGKRADRVRNSETGKLPVENVSWQDCADLCARLAEAEGDGCRYRLPTEAEWEWACRAGTLTPWSFGSSEADHVGYQWDVLTAQKRPQEVGTLAANAFGLHDMHGNVFEWCQDWFAPYPAHDGPDVQIDPAGPAVGTRKVFRGGSWWQRRTASRSAFRGHHFPAFRFGEHGVRLVRVIDEP